MPNQFNLDTLSVTMLTIISWFVLLLGGAVLLNLLGV